MDDKVESAIEIGTAAAASNTIAVDADSTSEPAAVPQCPVTVITGFLGAGKVNNVSSSCSCNGTLFLQRNSIII